MAATLTAPADDIAVELDADVRVDDARQARATDFSWLWGAHTVSTFGDQISIVALPLAVFARTHSALAVGIAASMEAATIVLFGMLAGVIADRVRHRPLLVGSDLVRFALLAAVALTVVGSPSYPVAILYAGAFAMGALRVVHDAAAGAALPLVVDGRALVRANSRLQGSEMAGNAVGPALAGGLMAVGGAGLAFLADALSFLGSGVGVARVRALRERAPSAPAAPFSLRTVRAEVAEGFRAVRSDELVVRAMVLIAAMNMVVVAVEAQFIPYARELLHVGSFAIGAYFALGGVVGVVTALLVGRSQTTRGDVMILGVVVFSLGVLAAGVHPSVATAALAYVGAGAGSVMAVTHWYSLRQRRFPVRLLGRVGMTTRVVLLGMMPVAYIAGGVLARAAGPQALFTAAAAVGLVVSGWATLSGLGGLRVTDSAG